MRRNKRVVERWERRRNKWVVEGWKRKRNKRQWRGGRGGGEEGSRLESWERRKVLEG